MSNFWQRTITGALFIGAVIGSILAHPLLFSTLFLLVVIIGISEFNFLVQDEKVKTQNLSGYLLGLGTFALTVAYSHFAIEAKWFLCLIPLTITIFISELYRKQERPFWNIGMTLLSAIYVAVPFSFLVLYAYHFNGYNSTMLLVFFAMVWMNDTGAYIVGVTMGKRKLFPRISPKKSWEGFFGGVLFTLLLAYIFSYYIVEVTKIDFIVMSLMISTFGTLGDLCESMLKRTMDIKDSGNILPGHGGVLDRFDALIFTAPLIYAYFEFFK